MLWFLASALVPGLGAASAVQASTITYTLTLDACSGTCGTANPFATVVLTDMGTGSNAFVQVTETLNTGEVYAASAGQALEFNLSSLASVAAVTNLSAGFSYTSGSATASAFGTFTNYIACSSCSGGNPGNPAGPLTSDIGDTSNSTGITTALFTTSSKGDYFASDIRGNNGNTGNVGDSAAGTEAPRLSPAPSQCRWAAWRWRSSACGAKTARLSGCSRA